MTCIVGIADGKQVWIGGDSAGTSGWTRTIHADSKVFANGPMVFGFTTSFRMGQLLRYKLSHPKFFEGEDIMGYLCGEWIDAVRSTLKNGGMATMKDAAEVGGCFLLGFKGRLFKVDSDYQVCDPADQHHAVGAGDELALGSLHATSGSKLTPEQRITKALEAAAYYNASVASPFAVIAGGVAGVATKETPQ